MDAVALWTMGLFQEIEFTNNTSQWRVLRVPGGWIMRECRNDISANDVFVPLDNEFLKKDPS